MSVHAHVHGVGIDRVDPGHWSYSGDPSSSPKDEVRFRLGDVLHADRLVSDAEIMAALATEGNDTRKAAAACFELLAGLFSREADAGTDAGRKALSQRAQAFAERAKELRASASTTSQLLGAMPYCGGISQSDKDSNDADSDQVQPYFNRDSFGAGHDAED